MQKLKLSFYNIVLEKFDNKYYVWNSKTGALIRIQQELYELMEQNCFDNERVKRILPKLMKEGIVVEETVDEIKQMLEKYNNDKFNLSEEVFQLVIAPTLTCNFRCRYCFENENVRKNTMSEGVVEGLVEFVERRMKQKPSFSVLQINWFGGEPLLAYDKMLSIYEKLSAVCSKYNVKLESKMTTNGYFLTSEKYEDLFEKYNLSSVQVTFDGAEEEYCARKRTLPDAYNKVKNNIFELSNYLHKKQFDKKIFIRLNVDKQNYTSVQNFVEEMKNDSRFIDNIVFYLGKLKDCQKDGCSYCYNSKEFEALCLNFSNFIGKKVKFPSERSLFCLQCSVNCYCVGPLGELYKCEHDFGCKEFEVGNIFEGFCSSEYYDKLVGGELDEECKTCKLFPICKGGCGKERLEEGLPRCEFSIDGLKNTLINIVDKK